MFQQPAQQVQYSYCPNGEQLFQYKDGAGTSTVCWNQEQIDAYNAQHNSNSATATLIVGIILGLAIIGLVFMVAKAFNWSKSEKTNVGHLRESIVQHRSLLIALLALAALSLVVMPIIAVLAK